MKRASFCIIFYLIVFNAYSQNKLITGKILTAEQLPIAGATIAEEGTNNQTISNASGTFSLTVSKPNATLVVSSVGYETNRYQLNGSSNVEIPLTLKTGNLSEVVVVGYGTLKKSDVTGAISSVKASDLKDLPTQRVDQALQGRAAGVVVQNTDAAPGGNTRIRVRGISSITGGNNALIVIDGQQDADINLINPNDVESMEILKDASATAIYGAKGSNGVILITTKSGKSGKPTISYSYNYGLQSLSHRLDLMNALEFAQMVNAHAALNNSLGTPPVVFTDAQLKNFASNSVDWQDVVYQTAPIQNHSLSISGGTDKLKYYFSGGYLDQKGIIVNSNYNRFNVRGNLKSDINNWVTAGINMAFVRSNGNTPPFGDKGSAVTDLNAQPIVQAPLWDGTIPVYDSAGNYSKHPTNYGNPFSWNPLAALKETTTKNIGTNNTVNAFLDFRILKGLSFKIMGSGLFSGTDNKRFFNDKTLNGRVINGAAGAGYLQTTNTVELQNTNILTYDREFNKHHLIFTGVAEQQQETFHSNDTYIQGFIDLQTALDDIGSANTVRVNSSAYKRSLNSYLGRINYSYENKYLLTASYRADGSSVFGANNKWGYFPSMALAWNASKEKFIENLHLFSDLKVRASWGIVGNQAISPYQSLAALSSGRNYPWNGSDQIDYGFQISQAENPNLKWESTTQTNVGLDMGFFNNRLMATIDLYKKNTNDLLLYRTLAGYTGLPAIIDNVGSTQNKGLELSVSGDPLAGAFKWHSGFNISWNKNTVVDMGSTTKLEFISSSGNYSVSKLMYLVPGQPFGQMYGYGTAGLWKESERAEALKYGQLPGMVHYIDVNGDGVIDLLDEQVIGNALPKYVFGWSNDFSYRGFNLSIMIQGVQGNDIFNMQKSALESPGSGTSRRLLDRWTPENQNTDVPAFIDDLTILNAHLINKINIDPNNANAVKRYVEDGSYTRLKNITLSYNVDGRILKRIGFNNIRLFVSATNLLTLTNYSGYDPEVSSYNGNDAQIGIDMGNYPSAKTFTFGTDINF